MAAPYEMGPAMWPLALILLLICLPKAWRRKLGALLQVLGLAVGILLLLPYLLS